MKRGTKRKRRSQKQRKQSSLQQRKQSSLQQRKGRRTHRNGRNGRKGRSAAAARTGAKKKGTDPCFEKRELSYIQKNPIRVYVAISEKKLDFYNDEKTKLYTQLYPNIMCFEPGLLLPTPKETYNYVFIKTLGNFKGQRENDDRLVFLSDGKKTLVPPTDVDIYEMLNNPHTF